jgi:hypothetical protein
MKKWSEEEIQILKNEYKKYGNKLTSMVGIDRTNNKLGYTKENCVSCCEKCNIMKKKYSSTEFLEGIKRIYEHLHLESL